MPVPHWKTSEYFAWSAAKGRCSNPRGKDYHRYGEKGVVMCPEWQNSFHAFLRDMGHKPSKLHQLDRFPNNDGNYEPGNCRWATPQEQQRNRRNNVLVYFEGRHVVLSALAEKLPLSRGAIKSRLAYGKSLSDPKRIVSQGWRK